MPQKTTRVLWGKEEVRLLKKLWPKFLIGDISEQELLDVFVSRTYDSIRAKARQLHMETTHVGRVNTDALATLRGQGIEI